MKNILTVLLLVQLYSVKGQTEFFVTVDPTTASFSIIDSLPGVNWIGQSQTTFDKNNHRYFFLGIDFSGNHRLYCIDATSGDILSQPTTVLNLGEIHYDNVSNTLYGLYLNNNIGKMFFVSLDISTANPTIIDTLPFTGYGQGSSFFDELNHSYVIPNSNSFYSINVISGNITVTPYSTQFCQIQVDNNSGNIYGLISGSTLQLVKINVSDGTYSYITTITTSGLNSAVVTFDEINQYYMFKSNNLLYSIDVNSGSIISSPTFPSLPTPQNLIEFHYDNSNGTLYALHWGTLKPQSTSDKLNFDELNFDINPNPILDRAIIKFKKPYNKTIISIFDSYGQIILKQENNNSMTVELKDLTLPSGIYHFSIIGDNKLLGTRRIIVD